MAFIESAHKLICKCKCNNKEMRERGMDYCYDCNHFVFSKPEPYKCQRCGCGEDEYECKDCPVCNEWRKDAKIERNNAAAEAYNFYLYR